ncbi:xylitol dehydrogenase, partial [Blyttiomyces sp. JEL0837]
MAVNVDFVHQIKFGGTAGVSYHHHPLGIVMSLYATLKNNPTATDYDIEESFDGNLCRCTGYRSILDGAKSLAINAKKKCSHPCATNGVCESKTPCDKEEPVDVEDLVSDPTKFPKTLLEKPVKSYYFENGDHMKWFHPSSLDQLLDIMAEHPTAKIINGNSEVGIETRFKNQKYPVLVYPDDVMELKKTLEHENYIEIGAGVTLSELQSFMKSMKQEYIEKDEKEQEHKMRGLDTTLEMIRWFAGYHVRNIAVIGGNIATASPISDLNPILMALNAILVLQSKTHGVRTIPIREFFLAYRKTALQPTEILVSIRIPFAKEHEYVRSFKQARRKDDDISIVNACMKVSVTQASDGSWTVGDACLVYGGMAPTSVIAKRASEYLAGKKWDQSLVDGVSEKLLEDFPLAASAPGGQIEFRKTLAMSFFHKFFLYVSSQIGCPQFVSSRDSSAILDIPREMSSGMQHFVEAPSSEIVGRSLMHTSALKQVTGAAVYIDDIPKCEGELAAAIVGSPVAHGRILNVDPSAALKVKGVKGYVCAEDLYKLNPDHGDPNMIGPVVKDEELFATREVHFLGQPIGLIVADGLAVATAAAKLVKVECEKLPAIFTIEEAIAKESFFPQVRHIKTGVFKTGGKVEDEDVVYVEGEARMAGQEHFYLEKTQHMVAHVLGIPSNRVTVRVKRMGGGFGGKETRSVFLTCMLAVAAKKFGKPMRLMLSREDDMTITGTRHPFLGKYKVGVKPDGQLVSLEVELFSNGGYSLDLSVAVLERAMTHSDNVYKIPNVHITGKICKTNLPTNTAFRGFGGPQGMMIAEQWMTHVSEVLKIPGPIIRRMNFYQNGDITHFNNPLDDFHFDRVWWELVATADYQRRLEEVSKFNSANRYKKRGIVLIPTKFG